MKEFMLLLSGEILDDPAVSLEERQEAMRQYLEWMLDLRERGIVKSGQPLGNQGRVVRNERGLITDGPFAETKEAVGGYFIVSANTLEDAVEIARSCPHVVMGGTIEVRPLQEI